eukprot:UN08544
MLISSYELLFVGSSSCTEHFFTIQIFVRTFDFENPKEGFQKHFVIFLQYFF